jgi:hypothetical protein
MRTCLLLLIRNALPKVSDILSTKLPAPFSRLRQSNYPKKQRIKQVIG